ncbi:MAG: LytTR family transcriptional regulator [Peptococcaceae bacterium]|nr:LytTR family transcriptional regulator [Peptococcaceae bacterium]
MRIIIQDPAPGEDDNVVISVRCMTDNIARAISLLKSPDSVTVYKDGQALLLPVSGIYYAESVDLKTFIYAEKAVFRSRQKLYEIEETLNNSDFLRISKQVVVNVKKIISVAPAGEGRFHATLKNSEKVIISRQYVPALKARFGL